MLYIVTEEGKKFAMDMGAAPDIKSKEDYKNTIEKILKLCEAAPEITEETKLSELGDGRVNAVSDCPGRDCLALHSCIARRGESPC
ncbi:hypothetical protein [Nitrosococcus wardiae]|uniref:Uncharacterized protein n=1 Tax=Nitrosococcus wardiae TaxID=1814290 RepID=A0A4P7C0A0_9GAMM|nr:hypothetical protein [Nitrosococcus wardiae]QBQ54930.1 hypothetical protein E3U44_10685 [Nitrosococcus wardiae]